MSSNNQITIIAQKYGKFTQAPEFSVSAGEKDGRGAVSNYFTIYGKNPQCH
jgi:hypothetical protein